MTALHRPYARRAADQDVQVLQAAAHWFATLREGADANVSAQWQSWLMASDAHRQAWDSVVAISARFEALDGQPVRETLDVAGQRRRRGLKTLVGLTGAIGLGTTVAWHPASRRQLAQMHTGVGETRRISLDDDSQLWLNTASAVNVRFGAERRAVELVEGEVLIQTHIDTRVPPRPFVVDLPYARLRAVGTRFSVWREASRGRLDVYDGAVDIRPRDAATPQVVPAGMHAWFDARGVGTLAPTDDSRTAWVHRQLVADNQPLAAFVTALSRYRHGYIVCAPEVAGLRLVGVYPLDDTDRILNALQSTLPVRVRRILPWWIRIEAA